MFNKDFFPTPADVIEQMLYGFDAAGKVILEPSAGKGNIVDWLQENGAKEVIACEINKDLTKILATKCRIIADNFLSITSSDVSHIDAIVMNPPFSSDEKHILHAYEIAPPGCDIISLCNYETYSHAYTRERSRLKHQINETGSFTDLGNCFTTAERKTDVRVGLVRLHKPGKSAENEFEGFFMEDEPEEIQGNGMMPYNFVRDLVNRYVAAVKLYDEQLQVGLRMNNLTSSFYSSRLAFSCTDGEKPKLREDFKKDLQKAGWEWVFDQMNMEKYSTKGLKDDINKFVEQQTKIPFTMRNIYKMVEIVIGTTKGRMDRAIIEVFDKFTQHTYDNRYNVEGWKTNSHYLLNEKFIVPHIVEAKYSAGMGITHGDYYVQLVDDLNKVLCYITGTNYDDIEHLWRFINYKKIGVDETTGRERYAHYDFNTWYDWGFFQIKGFKKGTMHFKFKDRDVWAIFNQHIARLKGYPLPETIKTTKEYRAAA